MTPFVDFTDAQRLSPPEPTPGGRMSAFPHDRLEAGPFTRRCSKCGRIDHSDTELPGTCEYCPGLVPLVAA
jgi:hypothetical protein